jgi:hypothetical protein
VGLCAGHTSAGLWSAFVARNKAHGQHKRVRV